MKRTHLRVNGKDYTVTFHPAYTHPGENVTQPAYVSIWTTWEVPSVADRYSAHPTMISKSAFVATYGRVGKKVMAELARTHGTHWASEVTA